MPMPTATRPSALAQLLRRALLVQWLLAALWLWLLWPISPTGAICGVLGIFLGYSVVLAVEMLVLNAVNRTDPAPPASAKALLRAWWAETRISALVFVWRQPFAWRREPDRCDPVSASGRRGVVLIHGFACNRGVWLPWLTALSAANRPFVAVNLEPVMGSIDAYTSLIDDAVQRLSAATGQAPVLVCHSMGGLAARAWLRADRGRQAAPRVHHIVTLGTPHHGTWTAQFSRAPSGQQMGLDSAWLRQLAQDEPPEQAALFTCWYSNADNVVFPASSATLPGACNRHMAGHAHLELALCPAVMQATLGSLERDDWPCRG